MYVLYIHTYIAFLRMNQKYKLSKMMVFIKNHNSQKG